MPFLCNHPRLKEVEVFLHHLDKIEMKWQISNLLTIQSTNGWMLKIKVMTEMIMREIEEIWILNSKTIRHHKN